MLAYFAAFFFIVGFILLLLGFRETQRDRTESASAKLQRIREKRGTLAPHGLDDAADLEMQREFARQEEQRASRQRPGLMLSLDKTIQAFRVLSRLEKDLQQLGSFWHASEMLTASFLTALAILFVFTWLGWGWFAVALAVLCMFSPWLYVKFMRARYYRRFEEQLADTLMLMSNSLRAGFSFLQAMEMVAREAPSPISEEFRMVTQEITIGLSISQALENLAARIKSPDLDLMVTAVIIQRETGGGLAEILDIIAAVIHERMSIKGEIRTLTTQGKLTGVILGMLPVALGLTLHLVSLMSAPNQPSFVEPLIRTQMGHLMLAIAFVMQMVGMAWILKIVSIRV